MPKDEIARPSFRRRVPPIPMGLVLNCGLLSRAGDARGIINAYAPHP